MCKNCFSLHWIHISALKTVDADKVYVLGGLVDESIQKVYIWLSEDALNVTKPLLFWNASLAEAQLLEGQRIKHPHGEAAYRWVHGKERKRQELPLKDPGH